VTRGIHKEALTMDSKKPAIIHNEDSGKGKRILCVGRIHKGKKTMIIAFPRNGDREHAVSENRKKDEEA